MIKFNDNNRYDTSIWCAYNYMHHNYTKVISEQIIQISIEFFSIMNYCEWPSIFNLKFCIMIIYFKVLPKQLKQIYYHITFCSEFSPPSVFSSAGSLLFSALSSSFSFFSSFSLTPVPSFSLATSLVSPTASPLSPPSFWFDSFSSSFSFDSLALFSPDSFPSCASLTSPASASPSDWPTSFSQLPSSSFCDSWSPTSLWLSFSLIWSVSPTSLSPSFSFDSPFSESCSLSFSASFLALFADWAPESWLSFSSALSCSEWLPFPSLSTGAAAEDPSSAVGSSDVFSSPSLLEWGSEDWRLLVFDPAALMCFFAALEDLLDFGIPLLLVWKPSHQVN